MYHWDLYVSFIIYSINNEWYITNICFLKINFFILKVIYSKKLKFVSFSLNNLKSNSNKLKKKKQRTYELK